MAKHRVELGSDVDSDILIGFHIQSTWLISLPSKCLRQESLHIKILIVAQRAHQVFGYDFLMLILCMQFFQEMCHSESTRQLWSMQIFLKLLST